MFQQQWIRCQARISPICVPPLEDGCEDSIPMPLGYARHEKSNFSLVFYYSDSCQRFNVQNSNMKLNL
jgi:hypothetical protein